MAEPENEKPDKEPIGISLGNVLVSGEDVLLHYELTKVILDFSTRNEIMTHKLIGLMQAVQHGLLTYTDMVCVSAEPEQEEDE
tara:strand:- start:1099 stop:1347 length:249 start_codon:yes stop_codon:yes gene_type:complete